ncbi:Lipoprotein signal peptidase [Frankliniella fusca]|uniref:Lipoprotein signal peptidase n=1 Tax=Frankliniella fusca TaxID=407009 RepID=A0AAE1LIG2_9NEOP|nr:Lipoprotein signal peptidase [Frankliniella fusca]
MPGFGALAGLKDKALSVYARERYADLPFCRVEINSEIFVHLPRKNWKDSSCKIGKKHDFSPGNRQKAYLHHYPDSPPHLTPDNMPRVAVRSASFAAPCLLADRDAASTAAADAAPLSGTSRQENKVLHNSGEKLKRASRVPWPGADSVEDDFLNAQTNFALQLKGWRENMENFCGSKPPEGGCGSRQAQGFYPLWQPTASVFHGNRRFADCDPIAQFDRFDPRTTIGLPLEVRAVSRALDFLIPVSEALPQRGTRDSNPQPRVPTRSQNRKRPNAQSHRANGVTHSQDLYDGLAIA